MNNQTSLYEFGFEELDRELIARGAQSIEEKHFEFDANEENPERVDIMNRVKELYSAPPPVNQEMAHICTRDIVNRLKEMSRGQKKEDAEEKHNRGIVEKDDRMDFYELEDAAMSDYNAKKVEVMKYLKAPGDQEYIEHLIDRSNLEKIKKIKKNIDAAAVICFDSSFKMENEFAVLRVKTFKEEYNLCACERFTNQPSVLGKMCTCFLVEEDVVATAGHFLNQGKVEDFRIVFGFKMENGSTPVTRVPKTNVYKGVKLFGKSHGREGNAPDWGLLKLDRKVKGQEIVKLSKDNIYCDQPVYTIGHPAGLPVKFATGASVHESRNDFFFRADLDIFMGNSGSPVFDRDTHEVIGLVAHGYTKDFRWVDGCWVSVIYPEPGKNTELSECTRVSEFSSALMGYAPAF